MELESKLSEAQKEFIEGAPTRAKRTPTEWIPRPPEKFSLTGHRATITKVFLYIIFVIKAIQENFHCSYVDNNYCNHMEGMISTEYSFEFLLNYLNWSNSV